MPEQALAVVIDCAAGSSAVENLLDLFIAGDPGSVDHDPCSFLPVSDRRELAMLRAASLHPRLVIVHEWKLFTLRTGFPRCWYSGPRAPDCRNHECCDAGIDRGLIVHDEFAGKY